MLEHKQEKEQLTCVLLFFCQARAQSIEIVEESDLQQIIQKYRSIHPPGQALVTSGGNGGSEMSKEDLLLGHTSSAILSSITASSSLGNNNPSPSHQLS